jgi:hypothetical protein
LLAYALSPYSRNKRLQRALATIQIVVLVLRVCLRGEIKVGACGDTNECHAHTLVGCTISRYNNSHQSKPEQRFDEKAHFLKENQVALSKELLLSFLLALKSFDFGLLKFIVDAASSTSHGFLCHLDSFNRNVV